MAPFSSLRVCLATEITMPREGNPTQGRQAREEGRMMIDESKETTDQPSPIVIEEGNGARLEESWIIFRGKRRRPKESFIVSENVQAWAVASPRLASRRRRDSSLGSAASCQTSPEGTSSSRTGPTGVRGTSSPRARERSCSWSTSLPGKGLLAVYKLAGEELLPCKNALFSIGS